MQKASHSVRAYFNRENRLKGFLVKSEVVEILRRASERKALQDVTRNQTIDIKTLLQTLENMHTNRD